jgi:alkylation response protein AidB-like acyl-CoA dehydrogenase
MTEASEALVGLAAEVFAGRTANDQLAAVERSEERWDPALWRELAGAGLLGLALPEAVGGAGLGLGELCLLLEQQGRFLAPVPLWETTVAALVLAEAGHLEPLAAVVNGSLRLSVAVDLGGSDGLVSGPFDALVVVDGDAVAYCPRPSAAERVGDLVRVALCAVQLGVAQAGLREAAQHLTGREQFGRPLATFQATTQQLGDAYCDVQAMRATLGQAAWTVARADVDVACWWATDAAERVQHVVQHLHGGLGADITYPVHRRLLWTLRTSALLGGPSRQLVRLGAALV